MEAASAPLTLPAVPAVAGPGAKPVNDTSRSRSGKARPALTVPMQLDAHQGSAQRGRGYTRGHTDRVLMQGIRLDQCQSVPASRGVPVSREDPASREDVQKIAPKIQRREKMYRRWLQKIQRREAFQRSVGIAKGSRAGKKFQSRKKLHGCKTSATRPDRARVHQQPSTRRWAPGPCPGQCPGEVIEVIRVRRAVSPQSAHTTGRQARRTTGNGLAHSAGAFHQHVPEPAPICSQHP